jgi:hypothetical protein
VICSGAIRVAVVIAFVILPDIVTARTPHIRPLKARTHVLATSTFIRGTWGTNQDIYLAEIIPHKGSLPILVRLMDEYLTFDPPLSVDGLTSTTGATLRIVRDVRCDIRYSQMQLRTAPGDPMAILPERLGYQPQLTRTPATDEVLSCYRTVRR